MDEIKIGDIIKPTTPARHKRFGNGMVISVKQAQRLPISVVFPSKDGTIITYDFKEDHVCLTKVTDEERKKMVEASYNYRQLMADLNRV